MNYAEMSDFDINRAVFIATGIDYEDISDVPIGGGSAIAFGDGCKWREYDFCNNPADMWPLIVRQKISLSMDGCLPCAYKDEIYDSSGLTVGSDYFFEHTNPLRAAAIVYLMMKEEGK